MRSCSEMSSSSSSSSSSSRPRYVSWCLDSSNSATASPAAPVRSISQLRPGSVPLLQLSPPHTESDSRCSCSWQTNPPFSSTLPDVIPSSKDPGGEEEGGVGLEGSRANLRPPEPENQDQEEENPVLQDGNVTLPRSSPVISRRTRTASGGTNTRSRSDPRLSSSSTVFSSEDFGQQRELDTRTRLRASPRPNKDHHHLSNIPDFSADIFRSSCVLEKENAHFIVVDLVLEVLEEVKWTLNPHTDCSACTTPPTHTQTEGDRRTQATRFHDYHQKEAERKAGKDEDQQQKKSLSLLSTDSGFEEFGIDSPLTHMNPPDSAESLAQLLVLDFKNSWFPSRQPRRGRLSLRSSLQELTGVRGGPSVIGSLSEEIRLRTRMRGSLNWAPPRCQIIFTLQPPHRLSQVVALQNFLCAGCGTEVEPKHMKKLRYCEYLGRYFCDCCHSGSDSVIPARVLSSWDFSRYPVSDFSKCLLESLWFQPLFDLNLVGKKLQGRVKELQRFQELQEQLVGVRKLLKTCRLSGRVVSEWDHLPPHLLQLPLLFSLEDLLRMRRGQLLVQFRELLTASMDHIQHCELCLARGFVCEFCREKDVIFPFQSVCQRCSACRSCFHKHCFVGKKCPKCARIRSRKKPPQGSMKAFI